MALADSSLALLARAPIALLLALMLVWGRCAAPAAAWLAQRTFAFP